MIHHLHGKSQSGAYGAYFKWDKFTGIKIIIDTKSESVFEIRGNFNQRVFSDVFIESTFFNLIHGSMNSEVVVCKLNNHFYLGIKMPHFSGRKVASLRNLFWENGVTKKRNDLPLIKKIIEQYSRKKMFNHDIHENNFIISNNQIKLIDFSPDCIQFYGKNSKVFKTENSKVLKKFEESFKNDFGWRTPVISLKKQIYKRALFENKKTRKVA